MVTVTEEEARAIPDDRLPIYTVLIPAYREPEVIGRLIESSHQLEYPRDKLDVKLLLEQDDPRRSRPRWRPDPGRHVEIVRVPPVEPRTKPKACNYGLAQRARAVRHDLSTPRTSPSRSSCAGRSSRSPAAPATSPASRRS